MDLLDALSWRYAVKVFDRSRKVPAETVERLAEAVRLTPTSLGLQPFRLVIVQDQAVKDALDEACWGQVQCSTSSHVFVLTCCNDVDATYVDRFMAQLVAERDLSDEVATRFRGLVDGFLERLSPAAQAAWEEKQAYIGLGNLLTAAAIEGIDACPMEGFEAAGVDKLLGLAGRGLRPVLLCPIGYRDASDHYQNFPKHRIASDAFKVVI